MRSLKHELLFDWSSSSAIAWHDNCLDRVSKGQFICHFVSSTQPFILSMMMMKFPFPFSCFYIKNSVANSVDFEIGSHTNLLLYWISFKIAIMDFCTFWNLFMRSTSCVGFNRVIFRKMGSTPRKILFRLWVLLLDTFLLYIHFMDIRFTIHNFMLMRHSILEDNVDAKQFSTLGTWF